MTSTIIGALLPIIITLLLGFLAGWHHDFDAKQAGILNRMVMLYALPLSLFAGMVSIPRGEILSQGLLAFAILLGMAGGFAVIYFCARRIFGRDVMTSALQALAVAGPAVPFVGVSVLGHLFGTESAIPISVASLVMNLIQVPATLMLLSYGRSLQPATAATGGAVPDHAPRLIDHILHALKEPVVWAPLLALVLVLCNLHFPSSVNDSLQLLGRSTGGVALFASGIVLFSRRVMLNKAVAFSVVLRNIALPAVIWGLLLLMGAHADTVREAVLTLAIPTASIVVILAVQYQTAEQEMASVLFFSTIVSLLTMGGFIWLTA